MNINDYSIDVKRSDKNYIMSKAVNVEENIIIENSMIFLENLITSKEIFAKYDLIVLGDFHANEVKVNGDMICLGDLIVDRYIDVSGNLRVFGKSDIKKGIINDDCYIKDGEIYKLKVNKNFVVDKSLEIKKELIVKQYLINNDIVFGEGKITASRVIFSGGCFIDRNNIDTNYINKENKNEKNKKLKLDFNYKDIQEFLNEQGRLNDLLNKSVLLQNKIKKYIKKSERDLDFDEIYILLEKLSNFNYEFELTFKHYKKVSELSYLNKITKLNNLFDLLIIEDEIPEYISGIGLVQDVLNYFLKNKDNIQITNINLKGLGINKLSKMIYLLKKNKNNIDSELYKLLSEELINEFTVYLN